jgi:hypothetical protein
MPFVQLTSTKLDYIGRNDSFTIVGLADLHNGNTHRGGTMSNYGKQVGAPDPEQKNSPIIEELDEELEALQQERVETPMCYFNGASYRHGAYVCSGNERLRCEYGSWVRAGSCDPDNP